METMIDADNSNDFYVNAEFMCFKKEVATRLLELNT